MPRSEVSVKPRYWTNMAQCAKLWLNTSHETLLPR